MAKHDLTSPLLPNAGLPQPFDESQIAITIDDDRCSESLNQPTHQESPTRFKNCRLRLSLIRFGTIRRRSKVFTSGSRS
ncbi:hypothetical protein U1Q18_003116 [Sarracenia purpurea var. burkii]